MQKKYGQSKEYSVRMGKVTERVVPTNVENGGEG